MALDILRHGGEGIGNGGEIYGNPSKNNKIVAENKLVN